jgi:LysR family transcriptional regulator, hydrogen peroxide-inducible genes activator
MNLRDLRYVLAVAELGHFGRAALACNVSQPTLSGQILKLEEELGVTLFERIGKSVRTTMAGEDILRHARRAITAADDLVECARTHRDPRAGPLRLGVIPTLGPYLMPLVLPRVRAEMPDMLLMLVEDLTGRLVNPVAEGQLDAAIIASDPEVAGLTEDFLFDEPFWVVMPADHELAKRKTVSASDIDPKSLLLLNDGHCLRDQALDLCGQPELGDQSMADMRATSLDTLLHMAAAGYGVTLVPHLALLGDKSLPGTLVARPLAGFHPYRRVRLISRVTSPRRKAIEDLAALIRGNLPEGLGVIAN